LLARVRDPYEVVLNVGATLTASLDLDEVLVTMARQVAEALETEYCDIHEYDPVAGTLAEVAVWTPTPEPGEEENVGTVLAVSDRPAILPVVRDGVVLEEYVDDPALPADESETMRRWGELASLEAPLIFGDETVGVVCVAERNDPARRFTAEDRRLLQLLAGTAAIAIRNARAYRARADRTRRLAALLDATRAITSTVDLDEVLHRVAEAATEVIGGSQSAIYEYRAEDDAIVYRSVHERFAAPDASPDDVLGTAYALADYPGERAILEGGEVVVEHASDPALPVDRRASLVAWGEKTVLNVPLAFRGEPVGILRVYDMVEERSFEPGEVESMRSLGELASAALHNARMFRAQADHRARLLDLFETSRALGSTFDLAAVAAAVEQGVTRLFGVGTDLWLRAGDGGFAPAGTVVDGLADDAPQASAPQASAAQRIPALAREALDAMAPAQAVHADGAALVVPIAVRDRPEGFVRVMLAEPRAFMPAEIEALQVLANLAAVALANAGLYRQVQEQAVRDGLTALYNHRHFTERLQQECVRARRYGLPLSLLMIDVDDFKRFNDEHGHQMGDEVLREVGRILAAAVRQGVDIPARYGGEEFAVILPHTTVSGAECVGRRLCEAVEAIDEEVPPRGAGALTVGERLREAVAAKAFAGRGGRRYARLTVSIGVAGLEQGEHGPDRLVANADKALYVAKRRGKNRTEVYTQ
jgi:diguanylate cyclase (GGDEF)-like protein